MSTTKPPRHVPTHPSLEGHPAWEAFKRAPFDTVPVSAEEARLVELARKGKFTSRPPHVRDVEEA